MIEFLVDYRTESLPSEAFKKGEQVTREETSERYFVGRGLAAYVIDGKLVDANHLPIVTDTVVVEVVRPGERRADLAVRAGEVMTDQPPRATSGPGAPFVEAAAGVEGAPAVVLEAEIERLKAALATGNDLFRDMNSSHEEKATSLLADIDRLRKDNADLLEARDRAANDLTELRTQHDDIVNEYKSAREELDKRDDRIASLEAQLTPVRQAGDGSKDDEQPAKTGKTKG
ncbi:hypothetical protein [Sphingobium sp. YR768]|uniref:hypothetical protein n=1 Tax=Sphingobium sp. YR768 TaxID=1884365 RepID=UPI0008AE5221|nr:hypothetical protein [Sphingobium sp. YR768]SEQ60356.1 hypothetical protein SAMN05518866_101488 [Sphingobium sp. YR768]